MSAAPGRIGRRFERLRREGRAGLIPFVTAGDPNHDASLAILRGLASAGADLIELGMPFSDPMADGPAIQEANVRALRAGASLKRTLELAGSFRAADGETPLVLMGYFNPIYRYGVERFARDAAQAGVDGVIVVDLPPEEDEELRGPARAAGLDVIRLATPTSDDRRLARILDGASGFIYYVSITGITGTKLADERAVANAVRRLAARTRLPIAVGFGIRTREQAAAVARLADAVVVGSALVGAIASAVAPSGAAAERAVEPVLALVRQLAQGVREGSIGRGAVMGAGQDGAGGRRA
ncbi:MAG: tryptophan synthase subunit alpha [Alphaproteobacteria bacterium]